MSSKSDPLDEGQVKESLQPFVYRVWKYLPEPRDQRVSHFLIYVSTLVGGIIATASLPVNLAAMIGPMMVFVLGTFSLLGSLIAMAGVLPGIGWLEQAGIILLFTAILIYVVALLYANATILGLWFAAALAIGLVQRWVDIYLKTR